MLVGDGDALQAVDFLDLVDEVGLHSALSEDFENVMRTTRTVDERVTGTKAFTLLHVDVHTSWNAVFLFLSVVGGDVNLALAFADLAEAYDTVDLGDDCRIAGLACLEEFDNTRETAGDVLGARCFARNLGKDVAGEYFVAVRNHKVGA